MDNHTVKSVCIHEMIRISCFPIIIHVCIKRETCQGCFILNLFVVTSIRQTAILKCKKKKACTKANPNAAFKIQYVKPPPSIKINFWCPYTFLPIFLSLFFQVCAKNIWYQFIIPKREFHCMEFFFFFLHDTIPPPYSHPSGPCVSMKNWKL